MGYPHQIVTCWILPNLPLTHFLGENQESNLENGKRVRP